MKTSSARSTPLQGGHDRHCRISGPFDPSMPSSRGRSAGPSGRQRARFGWPVNRRPLACAGPTHCKRPRWGCQRPRGSRVGAMLCSRRSPKLAAGRRLRRAIALGRRGAGEDGLSTARGAAAAIAPGRRGGAPFARRGSTLPRSEGLRRSRRSSSRRPRSKPEITPRITVVPPWIAPNQRGPDPRPPSIRLDQAVAAWLLAAPRRLQFRQQC